MAIENRFGGPADDVRRRAGADFDSLTMAGRDKLLTEQGVEDWPNATGHALTKWDDKFTVKLSITVGGGMGGGGVVVVTIG